jgi:hypothetical protein
MENKKSRSNVDYWDIIFNKCERCKNNQLWDEKTVDEYIRLTNIINHRDSEWISREYDEDMF